MSRLTSSRDYIENFEANKSVNRELQNFLPFAVALMACIDGHLHQNEIKKICELGKKFLGAQFHEREFLQSIDDVSAMLASADETTFLKWENLTLKALSGISFSSEEEKQALIALFCEVAYADGSVHEKETQFIDKISDAIGFVNPFEIRTDENTNKSELNVTSSFGQAAEAFSMIAKMITDALIESGVVPVNRRLECQLLAGRLLVKNTEKAIAIASTDDFARMESFLFFSEKIVSLLNLNESANIQNKGYSSTVYAGTPEELAIKKRKVSIYASIGLISIFGFLFSFGYSIYLFYSNTGTPVVWLVAGVLLFYLNKWIGKKHDGLYWLSDE